MKITIEPTNTVETFAGKSFRLFRGKTTSDIALQMLGMFRVTDAIERERFNQQLAAAVQHLAPQSVPLVGAPTLITGAEQAVKKRREMVARALHAVASTAANTLKPADIDGEGAWAQMLPVADKLLAKLEDAR